MLLLCFQGESAAICSEHWLQNENLSSSWEPLFRLLVEVLKHNNWHFLHSYGSIAMETATKPGSLSSYSEYLMTLRLVKWERQEI